MNRFSDSPGKFPKGQCHIEQDRSGLATSPIWWSTIHVLSMPNKLSSLVFFLLNAMSRALAGAELSSSESRLISS